MHLSDLLISIICLLDTFFCPAGNVESVHDEEKSDTSQMLVCFND